MKHGRTLENYCATSPKKTSWRAVGGHKATICWITAECWKPLRIPWLARRPCKFFASSDVWDPCKTPLLSFISMPPLLFFHSCVDSSIPPCVPSSFPFLLYPSLPRFIDFSPFLCFFLPFPRSFISSFLHLVSLLLFLNFFAPSFSSFFLLVLPCPRFSVSWSLHFFLPSLQGWPLFLSSKICDISILTPCIIFSLSL